MADVRDLLLAPDLEDSQVESLLSPYAFPDAHRVDLLLQRMCPTPSDRIALAEVLPTVLHACSTSSSPEHCLLQLDRLADAFGQRSSLYRRMADDPACLEVFFSVAGASRALADLLVINPEYLDLLADTQGLTCAKTLADLRLEAADAVDVFQDRVNQLDALRRMRRREYLRIGARELTGIGSFQEIVGEISDLAAALVGQTLAVCHEFQRFDGDKPDAFAVIAFGKLGARELNYSSDIDLAFVWDLSQDLADREQPFYDKLARSVVEALGAMSAQGRMYRVDLRLRPFGASGPVGCSVSQFLNYYESWSEPWERQALIKARTIAGPPALREKVDEFIQNFAFARPMDSISIAHILSLKDRSEHVRAENGSMERQVKYGWGGIRDVEFTVQLLQLVAGNAHPQARSPATLDAVAALEGLELLSAQESAVLEAAYIFLRQVEHRLQLSDELPTQRLPDDPAQLRSLALSLGYRDENRERAEERFSADYTRNTEAVRQIHQRLFKDYLNRRDASDADWAVLIGSDSDAQRTLSEMGFESPAEALRRLRQILHSENASQISSEPQRRFLQTLPELLKAVSGSPDPDLSLAQLQSIAGASGSPLSFFRSIGSGPGSLEVFARLASASEFLGGALARHPEYIDLLSRAETLSETKSLRVMSGELDARLKQETTRDGCLDALRRYRLREFLRIGAQDVAELASVREVTREISDLAEACLRSALKIDELCPDSSGSLPGRLGILGMGKLGGRELHYSSDLDLVCVYLEAPGAQDGFRAFDKAVRRVLDVLSRLTAEGRGFQVDLRLRPQGNAGMLAISLDGYTQYLHTEAQAWERQAMVRARHVAGDAPLSRRLLREMHTAVWGRPLTQEDLDQVRHVKRRIESEKSAQSENLLDLKRGPGCILDIEFTTQIVQLAYGATRETLRQPNTVRALKAARAAGVLGARDAKTLIDAYLFLRRAENRLQMAADVPAEGVSLEPDALKSFARRVGYAHTGSEAFLEDYHRHTVASRKIHERVFFESDLTREAWGDPSRKGV